MRRIVQQIAFVAACLLAAVTPATAQRTVYVDNDGPADFATIQAAIDAASDGDTILIASGTYTGDGNRDIDFKGKAITVEGRDGPETCIVDAGGRQYVNNPEAEPELHRGFYFHRGEDANSMVRGLTITGGYLRWDGGGGICCEGASPQIITCVVTANVARWGGGIAITDSNAVIVDCTISDNMASFYPWNRTGGGSAGGISMAGGNVTMLNCLIVGNFASDDGGGIRTGRCDFVLRNCTISENRARSRGAGLYCASESSNTGMLDNCILWANKSVNGYSNEIGFLGGILGSPHLELNHSVVQDHGDHLATRIYGTWTGTDPCFVRPGYWDPNGTPGRLDDFWVDGDFHLRSQAGRWDQETESWVQDDVTSACIEAGDPCSAMSDEPFPNGGVINLGAYGGTAEASKSYPGITRVLYVDDDIATGGDGSSWSSAYRYLQDALAQASLWEGPVEIRVAQGRYTPDQGAFVTLGDREAVFQMAGRMTLLGAYGGAMAPDPNERNVDRHETVLSGDLENNDEPTMLPLNLPADSSRADNSHSIIAMTGSELFPCVLDGFRVDSAGESAALSISLFYPSIKNCAFINNVAGAVTVDLLDGGHPHFVNCRFLRNTAPDGAAIYTSGGTREPSPTRFTLRECTFTDNRAVESGGAIVLRTYKTSSLQDCVFLRNSARLGGAVFLASEETANMANCLLAGNWAAKSGGGVYLEGTQLNAKSCTFADNRATTGRAVASPYAIGSSAASIAAVGLIVRDGGDELSNVHHLVSRRYGMDGNVAFSDVDGGMAGEGNIDVDPLFANPGYWDANGTPDDPGDDFFVVGDYHLKSQAGRWDPNSASWVADDVTSPCIDAGDPNSPIGDEPEPNGGIINMGVYGGTTEASKSGSGVGTTLD